MIRKIYFLALILTFLSCEKKMIGYYDIPETEKEVYQIQCQILMTDFFKTILSNYTDPDLRSYINQLESKDGLNPIQLFDEFHSLVEQNQYKLVENFQKANSFIFEGIDENVEVIELLKTEYTNLINSNLEYVHMDLKSQAIVHNIYVNDDLTLIIEILPNEELYKVTEIINQDVSKAFRIEEVMNLGEAISILMDIDNASHSNSDSTKQNSSSSLFSYLTPKTPTIFGVSQSQSAYIDPASPIIGTANSNDTNKVNNILINHELDLMNDIDFAWGRSDSYNNASNEIVNLYFLRPKYPLLTITNNDLFEVNAYQNEEMLDWRVRIIFGMEGTKKWFELTSRNIGKALAIIVDNEVITCPVVMQEIVDGSCEISGQFNEERANEITNSINKFAKMQKLKIVNEAKVLIK